MTQVDLQRGGGFTYQWECAILLALNYLMDSPSEYNLELHKVIDDFLGRVSAIRLEGKTLEGPDKERVELEDINLLTDEKAVCVQVKAKEAESGRWVPSDPLLCKALYRFYRNTALDQAEPSVWFVFLSNRPFNPALVELKKAISAGNVAQSEEGDHLFDQVQKYVSGEYPEAPPLERMRFDQLLNRLALIEFLSTDELEAVIKNHLGARGVEDWEQGYQSFYTVFSKRSVVTGGSPVTLSDLYDIVGDFFAGRLLNYILAHPRRLVATYLLDQAEATPLPPYGVTSATVIKKIESIIGSGDPRILNGVEAFVLVVATCLPHLLRQYDEYDSNEWISVEQVHRLAEIMDRELSVPDGLRTTLGEVASEVSTVANALAGFELDDDEYSDRQVRDARVRLRLLAALLHLGSRVNLDQAIDPTPHPGFDQQPWPERYQWWCQAYVCGVSLESQRLQLHVRLPRERKDEYEPYLVQPLDEELAQLVDRYDSVFFPAGINLKHLPAEVVGGEVPDIPADEWQLLKQEIETQQARKSRDRLQQDTVRTQRLRELLVKAEVDQAEQMATEGRHRDAAEAFARAAALLARAQQVAQARHYAVRSAEHYLEADDPVEAVEQYLLASEGWLYSAYTPGLATSQLERAHELAVELDMPALQVRVLIAQAWAAFADLRDYDAESVMAQANDFIPQIVDASKRADLLRKLALQHATLAMVWEEWNTAREVLDAALATCPEGARDERLDLLEGLLRLSTECGDWETADRVYQEAQEMLGIAEEPRRRGMLMMHYGASLARRGALQQAYEVYSEAIENLEGNVDAYTLGLAYRNMQYMLLRNGPALFTGFDQHEVRRIDLSKSTQAQNIGYAHELQASADLVAQKYRGALQHIRLALATYWREGAWSGIERAYKTLAAIHEATDKPDEALISSIRAGDQKMAQRYSEILRDRGNAELLAEIVESLAADWPAACESKVAVKALGVLADVIPPTLLEQVFSYLMELLRGTAATEQHANLRRYAAEALRNLIPQLTVERTSAVVQVALDQFQQQQPWTLTEELLRLLDECFTLTRCQVDSALYAPVVESMLSFEGDDHLRSRAERVAFYAARTAPADVRSKVVAYLREEAPRPDRLGALVLLEESIAEDQLESTLKRIVRAINPQPKVVTRGSAQTTSIDFSAIGPGMINNFNEVLPAPLYDLVIDGLLEAVINEHNPPVTRTGAIWALSDLPVEALVQRADEIVDYVLWGADGTLPRSSIVDMQLESQTAPFSAFRMNVGNVDQVRQSCLHALGKLYAHVGEERKERISNAIITAGREESPTVRQGAAMALSQIVADKPLPSRLLLSMVVLLHDADPRPCSRACVATGRLISRGLADPFTEDLVERLLDHAENTREVDIRVGAAIGLGILAKSDRLAPNHQEPVLAALVMLSDDVSFRVRREASAVMTIIEAKDG